MNGHSLSRSNFAVFLISAILLAACHPAAATRGPLQTAAARREPVSSPASGSPSQIPALSNPARPSPTLPAPVQAEGFHTGDLEVITAENAARLEPIALLSYGEFQEVVDSPDGKHLAAMTTRGVVLFDLASGRELGLLPTPGFTKEMAFSPDGNLLVVTYSLPSDEVYNLGFELDGRTIFKPSLAMWRLDDRKQIWSQSLDGSGCGEYDAAGLSFSPDGSLLVYKEVEYRLKDLVSQQFCVLSSSDGKLLRSIPVDTASGRMGPFAISPDGGTLATWVFGVADSKILFYSPSNGKLARTIAAPHLYPMRHTELFFSPDGERLVMTTFSAGEGGTSVQVWSAHDAAPLEVLKTGASEPETFALSPDWSLLATQSYPDSTIHLWNTSDGSPAGQIEPLYLDDPYIGETSYHCQSMRFSRSGEILFAILSGDPVYGTILIGAWQIPDGQELYRISARNNTARSGFSPDGRWLAVAGYPDASVQIWSIQDGRPILELQGHSALVNQALYSPDGRLIATASGDNTIRLWNTADGSLIQILTGHTDKVLRIAFSPDGSRLASVSEDGTIRTWRVSDGSPMAVQAIPGDNWKNGLLSFWGEEPLIYDTRNVRDLDLSPDRKIFARLSAGVQIGHMAEEHFQVDRELFSPMGTGAIEGLALTPDGNLVFSCNAFGLHAWETATGQLIALAGSDDIRILCGTLDISPDGKMLLTDNSSAMFLWGIRP